LTVAFNTPLTPRPVSVGATLLTVTLVLAVLDSFAESVTVKPIVKAPVGMPAGLLA
jgi:hypothetical protein